MNLYCYIFVLTTLCSVRNHRAFFYPSGFLALASPECQGVLTCANAYLWSPVTCQVSMISNPNLTLSTVCLRFPVFHILYACLCLHPQVGPLVALHLDPLSSGIRNSMVEQIICYESPRISLHPQSWILIHLLCFFLYFNLKNHCINQSLLS